MTKKKILVLALSLAMVAILAVGGSLAYFTSDDHAENTFTVGNVKIELIEQQRTEDGTELEAFEQGKALNPIVGSAQGEKDKFGMPIAKNYVDKMVTIKNTGKNDAYIRAYFAIPSALDDGYETFNAGANVLHFNFGNKIDADGNITSTEGAEWKWTHGSKWNYFETTIDGIEYNVYFADYYQAVGAGETTAQFVQGVYLDKSFDYKDDGYHAFGKKLDGLESFVSTDAGLTVTCPVYAVAMQAAGFDNAAAAIEAAFGKNYNPWGGATTNWQ